MYPNPPSSLSFLSVVPSEAAPTTMATAAAPAPNADDILGQHRFVTPTGAPAASGPSSSPYAPTASSILAGTSLDAAALHPLAGVVDNKELDYLLLEDDKLSSVAGGKTVLPSRGWGDELCYGTGSTYLAGAPFSLLTYLMPLENI
jgi:import inner membrane translocase subunit TIM23